MRIILIALAALALPLSACSQSTFGPPPTPSDAASTTVLDEKAAIAVETAYTAAAKAMTLAIQTGVIDDADHIKRVGELDTKAYNAVLATRAAYKAGNAASYSEAFGQANAAIKMLLSAF